MIDDLASDRPRRARFRAADDFERPGPARVYDFLLGGASHGAVDREFARDLLATVPRLPAMVRENRAFVRRAVDHLVDAEINQFLDLGSGVPSIGSTHEVARRRRPGARVVYVDVDPVVAAHADHILGADGGLITVRADLRDPAAVLAAPGVRDLLDLSRPVGLLMFSSLQHVSDADDPAAIVGRYLDHLAPGSALALSHLSDDDPQVELGPAMDAIARAYWSGRLTLRSRAEVAALTARVHLVCPGLVWADEWRPEEAGPESAAATANGASPAHSHYAAVGFLPATTESH